MGTRSQLRKAIAEGDQTMVESLFDEGFDVGDRLHSDWTPLHVAAHTRQLPIAHWLISKAADVNAETPLWQTPLDLALRSQDSEMVAFLRRHGGKEGVELSLHAAVFHGDMPSAKKHFASGSNPNLIRHGQLAICVALRRRRFAEAKFLLKKGVSVTNTEEDGETALHAALRSGAELAIVKTIIVSGADLNARDGENLTAVHVGIERQGKESIEFLIAHGAKLATEEEGEDSLVQTALDFENRELAHWFIDHGVRATIHQATEAGHALQVQEHLRSGIDANTLGVRHRTSLIVAVASGHFDIAELLLRSGADPNIADDVWGTRGWPAGGDTALHKAVEAEAADLVRLLIAHGADPDATNATGESPRQVVARRKCPHLLRLMEVPVTGQNRQHRGKGSPGAQIQQFFLIEKVAQLLSVEPAFVIELIRDRKLKTVKMDSKTVRIPADSLSQYLMSLSEGAG